MYISRWSSEGRVPVYKLLVSHDSVWIWARESVKHTGSLPNLYVNVWNKEELDNLEHEFACRIESPAKEPFDKLCDGNRLTSDEWKIIGDYIAIQYVRTPVFYLWVKEWGMKYIPEQIDAIGKKLANMTEFPHVDNADSQDMIYLPINAELTDIKPDEKHTYVKISAVSGKGLWLFQIKHTLEKDSGIRQFFRRLRWSIITAPDGESWPTCDNPVVVCDITGNELKKASASGGLAGKSKAIIFPISPEKMLFAMPKRDYKWLSRVPDMELFHMMRSAVVNNAMLYVYSSTEDGAIPCIRPRIVNKQEFNRIKNDFENWFDMYKETEGPLLNR